MTPQQNYQKALQRPDFEPDLAQAQVVDILQHTHQRLADKLPSSTPISL
jgi:predicted ATPase